MDEIGEAPEDFARWGLHCFCLGARRTPQAVLREGDNGRLLYRVHRAPDGVERAALGAEAGRLARLAEFGLIRADGGRWRLGFPALGPAAAGELRARVAAPAGALAARIAPQVLAITDRLAALGLGASGFALVFGHLLDGLFWEALAARGALPETRLDAAHPWWRGAFWAVWPPRAGAAGVNVLARGEVRLMLVWTEPTVAALRGFAARPEVVAALERGVGRGPVARLGGLALPVVTEAADDPLGRPARVAAAVLAAEFLSAVPRLTTGLLPAGTSAPVAAVIAGHELIWTLAEHLVAGGRPPPPGDAVASRIYLRIGA